MDASASKEAFVVACFNIISWSTYLPDLEVLELLEWEGELEERDLTSLTESSGPTSSG